MAMNREARVTERKTSDGKKRERRKEKSAMERRAGTTDKRVRSTERKVETKN
ncbi:hypothetical protein ABH966_002302 [Lysinibacillus sp. RC46]|uniref:hypothetical protein n=1 Tax=unclassified Lysinibacillus TaxID=2636778 RepID=UPI00351310CA